MHSLLSHGHFIFGSDVKLCKEIVLDPDLDGGLGRGGRSGCFLPEMKCLRASGLVNEKGRVTPPHLPYLFPINTLNLSVTSPGSPILRQMLRLRTFSMTEKQDVLP